MLVTFVTTIGFIFILRLECLCVIDYYRSQSKLLYFLSSSFVSALFWTVCFISDASECPAFFDSLGGALESASSGDSIATLEGCDWEEQPDLNPNGVLLLVFIMHRGWDPLRIWSGSGKKTLRISSIPLTNLQWEQSQWTMRKTHTLLWLSNAS